MLELRPGTVTERAHALLARIDGLNPRINAYVAVDRDAVLREAARLDAVAPGDRGPLHGVTVAVKDIIDVAGLPTRAGSSFFRRDPDRDAPVVAALRAAGALIDRKDEHARVRVGDHDREPALRSHREPVERGRTRPHRRRLERRIRRGGRGRPRRRRARHRHAGVDSHPVRAERHLGAAAGDRRAARSTASSRSRSVSIPSAPSRATSRPCSAMYEVLAGAAVPARAGARVCRLRQRTLGSLDPAVALGARRRRRRLRDAGIRGRRRRVVGRWISSPRSRRAAARRRARARAALRRARERVRRGRARHASRRRSASRKTTRRRARDDRPARDGVVAATGGLRRRARAGRRRRGAARAGAAGLPRQTHPAGHAGERVRRCPSRRSRSASAPPECRWACRSSRRRRRRGGVRARHALPNPDRLAQTHAAPRVTRAACTLALAIASAGCVACSPSAHRARPRRRRPCGRHRLHRVRHRRAARSSRSRSYRGPSRCDGCRARSSGRARCASMPTGPRGCPSRCCATTCAAWASLPSSCQTRATVATPICTCASTRSGRVATAPRRTGSPRTRAASWCAPVRPPESSTRCRRSSR